MRNEQGYILPFVLMVCTLLFFILTSQLTLYTTEMQFSREQEELMILERMVQKSLIDLEPYLSLTVNTNSRFSYEEGNVNLSIQRIDADRTKMILSYETNQNRKTTIHLYYNHSLKKFEKWIEGR